MHVACTQSLILWCIGLPLPILVFFASLYGYYVFLWPLCLQYQLQLSFTPSVHISESTSVFVMALVCLEVSIFTVVYFLAGCCFIRCIWTNAKARVTLSSRGRREETHDFTLHEYYGNVCTSCLKPKPPRSHHCSICKRCYQKMDHHCAQCMHTFQ